MSIHQIKFAKSHEWVKDNGDGSATIGISHHAQELLGDVVYVELPEAGDSITAGEGFSLIESVKAASDVYAPISGKILAVNILLEDKPELINESPLDNAWIVKITIENESQFNALLTENAYEAAILD
jgi:glycine cleavage system H protein